VVIERLTLAQAIRLTGLSKKELLDLDITGVAKATRRGRVVSYNWSQLRRAHRIAILLRTPGTYDPKTLKPKRRVVSPLAPIAYLVPRVSFKAAEEAEELFAKACAIDDDLGSRRLAEGMYQRVIVLNPGLASPCVNLGRLLFLRGLEREAEGLWVRALALDPGHTQAAHNMAHILLLRNDYETAIQYALHAIKGDSRFADPYWTLAECWTKLGNTKNARECWVSYIKYSDDERYKRDAWAQLTKLG
jgi:tetratricopeptide (TPR) repeat protein